jgi:hypothetical protein
VKITFGAVALTSFAAGLIAGVLGGHFIPLAHAASDRVILIETDSEIATKCNFDKTVVKGPRYWACVRL